MTKSKHEQVSRAIHGASLAAALVLSGVVLGACSSDASEGANVADATSTGALTTSFRLAAEHASVPRDLLVAVARVEDGLAIPAQRLDIDADTAVPAAGPLMLRRGKLDTLALAAQLSGKSELALRQDAGLALDAGALVLAELGAKSGAREGDLASWKSALEEMSGYADEAHREEYAHRVFATLARGGTLTGRDGEKLTLGHYDLPPTLTLDISSSLHTLTTAEYPGAEWIPTSCNDKCNPGRDGASVEYIVIHDTEGGWDASVATLQNDSGKSVQYIVGTDGRVAQFVIEDTTAWHAGNSYFNARSVGIEHVGYSSKPYTEAEYAASAKLVDYLATKYEVARDRAHIIGHEQIPNGNRISSSASPCGTSPKTCEANLDFGGANHHTDPGVWEWATYMPRFAGAAKCNDVTAIKNCSYDKSRAFKCVDGAVVVDTCNGPAGCTVMPNGQDDACDVTIQTATGPHGDDPSADPTTPGSSGSSGAPAFVSDEPAASDDSGGCTVAPASGRGSSSGVAFTLLTLALAVTATRRRRTS